ncbi:kinase-like protein, partial [Pyrenochaeta sp. DS3sAY3a]
MRVTKSTSESVKVALAERTASVAPSNSTLAKQVPFDGIEVSSRAAIPFTHKAWLGFGSSAGIELVSENSTNELYALKTFKRYLGRNFEAFYRSFQNEVCVTQRLSSHKHIVSVCQTYKWGRQLSILLSPAASDGDLGAYIAEIFGAGMSKEQRKVLNRAFGCLASGLAYMHRQKIRHKDIKPQNILIHQGSVLYTDFGISFDADDDNTTTIGYVGAFTRRYCAPEVQDHTRRDRKSDVYSLGCVFVEILDVLEPQL